jgi:hypothetical protein
LVSSIIVKFVWVLSQTKFIHKWVIRGFEVDDGALVGFGSSWPPNLTIELVRWHHRRQRQSNYPMSNNVSSLVQVSFASGKMGWTWSLEVILFFLSSLTMMSHRVTKLLHHFDMCVWVCVFFSLLG